VAGLGASAVCSAFAFHSIVHATGGDALATATNLAYPIGTCCSWDWSSAGPHPLGKAQGPVDPLAVGSVQCHRGHVPLFGSPVDE